MKKEATFTSQYKGNSICNILPTIAKFNGIKTLDGIKRYELSTNKRKNLLGALEKSDRIVFLQIDALGYDLFSRVRKNFDFLKNSVKISSVFPTYTHTALASFVTGTSPSKHGIVAGTFLKDGIVDWIGNLSKIKSHSKNLFTCESLLSDFEKQGKRIISILYDVNDDYYSRYLYPNPVFVSSNSSADSLIKQAYEVEERVFDKILELSSQNFYILTAYFWFLDGISGKYGKFNKNTLNYLNFFFKKVGYLITTLPHNTLFIIIGDHGHTELKKTVVIRQEDIDKINHHCNSKFALDGRLMMFYSANPDLVRKMFSKKIGNNVEEVSRKDYVHFLGGGCKAKDRIGDLIYLAKSHCTVRVKFKKKKATHGGLSKEETETVLGFFMS